MLSNGAFKWENLTALECILSIAVTMANYWIMAIFFCLTCMRDFCEIFIFTTSKIVERVIWTLEISGFEQINEKICSLVSSRGVGTQTDLSLHNVDDQPVPIIKLTHAPVSFDEKESQTSPLPNLAHGQDFTFLEQNSIPKHDRSRSSDCSRDFAILQQNIPKHDLSRSSSCTRDCTFLQQNNTSKHDRSRSSACSRDFTILQQTIPKHDLSRSSSCTQDFTFLQQNNIPKHLNVVDEVEKLTPAIINVDFKPSPIKARHISQSPVCAIHLTPCSTNLKVKYSKVLVDSMSPEEISYLRRKWNNLKNSKKRSYLKMEPIFPSNVEDSNNERRPKKLKMMIDCENKESVRDVESPEMKGCYKNLLLKLKSKFKHRNDPLVSYTNL